MCYPFSFGKSSRKQRQVQGTAVRLMLVRLGQVVAILAAELAWHNSSLGLEFVKSLDVWSTRGEVLGRPAFFSDPVGNSEFHHDFSRDDKIFQKGTTHFFNGG